MSTRIYNTLTIHSDALVFQEIADIFLNDSWCTNLNWDWTPHVYDAECNYDTNSIYFDTYNEVPGKLVEKLTGIYKGVEMNLKSYGGYFGRFFSDSTFINGYHVVFKHYEPCDFRIKVPATLGYEENIYETCVFLPELFGIDRNDLPAVAEFVLQEAIEYAPNQNIDEDFFGNSEIFTQALNTAIKSITKFGGAYEAMHNDLRPHIF